MKTYTKNIFLSCIIVIASSVYGAAKPLTDIVITEPTTYGVPASKDDLRKARGCMELRAVNPCCCLVACLAATACVMPHAAVPTSDVQMQPAAMKATQELLPEIPVRNSKSRLDKLYTPGMTKHDENEEMHGPHYPQFKNRREAYDAGYLDQILYSMQYPPEPYDDPLIEKYDGSIFYWGNPTQPDDWLKGVSDEMRNAYRAGADNARRQARKNVLNFKREVEESQQENKKSQ